MKTTLCKPNLLLGCALALAFELPALAQTSQPATVSAPRSILVPAARVSPLAAVPAAPASSVLPDGMQMMMEELQASRGTNSATGDKAAAKPKTFAEAVAKLKFDRTPEALLEAVKAQQSGTTLSEAELFRIAVLLGDWNSVSNKLNSLPEEEAKPAYAKLLTALAGNSQSAAQFYQQTPAGQAAAQFDAGDNSDSDNGDGTPPPNRPQRRKPSLLVEQDFYALVDAAPANLDTSNLPQISSLVKIAVGNSGKKQFLTRLEKGLKGYGGSTAEGRKLAAQLLSSLDWMADAAPYLPLKREEWDQADTLSLVLAMEHFTQMGVQQRDERQLKHAAELCAFMMQTSRFGADDRGLFRQATDRFVKLLPALENSDAEQLIRENFLTQPAILNDLLLTLGETGQQAQRGSDLALRAQSLATQSTLLRVLASRKSALPAAANVLVVNWLSEAETTYRSGRTDTPEEDTMDNPFVYRLPGIYYNRMRNQAKVVKADLILTNAPTPALIRRLNEGLAQRVNLTLMKVNLMDPKDRETIDRLKAYLKEHPGQEKELCQDYLSAWVKKRTVPPEDPNVLRMRSLGYIIQRQQQVQGGGIPLTRLRQNKNVAEYQKLLAELRPLSPEPLSPKSVVDGFMAIHSGAEVYRAGDIEAIFGPAETMNHGELMQLVTGMRTKLREQWQDPKVQQDAGSNRTEEEAKDEVSRGYQTAIGLVKRGLSETNSDWQQFIVRGQLFFDASEFEFARHVKLSEYVSLRDEAFGSYREAAKIYAAKVPELSRGQWTLEPYQMWFFVMLGASDLAQLTRAAARSDPGLSQIGDAMRALPGAAAEGHLQKFGEMLGSLLPQVPANMRQKFLSAGLQVVGENHPAAKVAQTSLKNYQELLDEAQLRLALDGPPRVGHGQPFGVVLSLEHTRQIARESGGFAKYLQNATSQRQGMLYQAPGAAQANYRDNFTKNIHGALDETFDVVSVTFAGADVRAIDLPREGWQQTPLAYLVLRAKESAVDRIPSIQIDMDFSDTSGQVVLPVRSQVESIDAKEATPAPRPCPDLALTFTMDEREWGRDGRAVVEVSAKGHGVIPDAAQLFDFKQAGFDCEVTDNGVSIGEFASDGKSTRAQADRNWQFTYKRRKDLQGEAVLKFPAVKSGLPSTAEYQHYQDADTVKLTAAQAAAGVALKTSADAGLRNVALVLLAAALVAGAWWLARARRRPQQATAEGLVLPAQITPFTVAAFLRRIQREAGGRLDESARTSLQQQIAEIESAFFRSSASAGAPDLESVARKWLQAAR